MESLKTFFENPFLDARISIDNFKKFSEDHLARITAQSGRDYPTIDALVGPTGAVHLAYFGEIADVAVSAAVQQGITKSVDAKLKQFQALVKKEEPGIKYNLGADSAGYQQFFPHGLSEYSRATRANAETLMVQFRAAADAFSKEVRPGLGDMVKAIRDEYQALRGGQLGRKGMVGTERSERDAARTALAVQLWKNVLTIALARPGEAEACLAYFDESIIKTGRSGGSDDGENV